ncbi:MAG: S1 RNA-binding domain-containing protein [Candidatus Parcubacteria bacterium]|nr:S1 RNA-binding domain-containing protein [Candidatus Paceibacterota bacterium]
MTNNIQDQNKPTMSNLLSAVSNAASESTSIKVGDKIEGKVIFVVKNQVLIQIENIGIGVIRGKELYTDDYISKLQIGEIVEAMVLALDSELGALELSFKSIGHDKVIAEIKEAIDNKTTVDAKIREVNRGGFMVKVRGIEGFLPASLLSPTHAIKQIGTEDKSLLNQMKKYVGQIFKVKIISLNPDSESIIVSERAVNDELITEKLNKYKIGDVVEGVIAGAVDFGLFVRFDENLDGLVHISEIAWKKVDDPRNEYKKGDKVTVKIIDIDKENRINLSIKQTMTNPWTQFVKASKVGDAFKGKIGKIVSYGVIVVNEDTDIQGLCHISQISDPILDNPTKIHDLLKLGDIKEFKILSLDNSEKLYLTLLEDFDKALQIQTEIVAKQEADKAVHMQAREDRAREAMERQNQEREVSEASNE